jgi:hypothetical protein
VGSKSLRLTGHRERPSLLVLGEGNYVGRGADVVWCGRDTRFSSSLGALFLGNYSLFFFGP